VTNRTAEKRFPLQCVVADGALIILVSADVVKYATEHHEAFYDHDHDVYRFKVADPQVWLQSVAKRLTAEFEGGSTPLSRLFDQAIETAVDQGDEGLEDEDDGIPY